MNNEAEHLKLKLLQQLEQSKKLQQDNFTEAQEQLNASLTPILQNLENALAQAGIDELNKTLRTMTEQSEQYRHEFEDMSSEIRHWKTQANNFSQQISQAQDNLHKFQVQTAEHLNLIGHHSTLVLEENKRLKQQIQNLQAHTATQDQNIELLIALVKNDNAFLKAIQDQQNQNSDMIQRNHKYVVEITWVIVGMFLLIMIGLVFKG